MWNKSVPSKRLGEMEDLHSKKYGPGLLNKQNWMTSDSNNTMFHVETPITWWHSSAEESKHGPNKKFWLSLEFLLKSQKKANRFLATEYILSIALWFQTDSIIVKL